MTTDQINYLNIGLMALSLIAALMLPFEVFLFSYAILGPLHYLTEISWLHDRNYFSKRRWDWIPLVFLAVLFVFGAQNVVGESVWTFWKQIGLGSLAEFLKTHDYTLLYLAFGLALVFAMVKDLRYRLAGIAIVVAVAVLFNLPGSDDPGGQARSAQLSHPFFTVFAVYLPTLIHVCVFTGAFMLYGALKRSSRSGYLAFGFFLCCIIACFALFQDTSGYTASQWALDNYSLEFQAVNLNLIRDFTGMEYHSAGQLDVFTHPLSILIARLIAFAYTYHYLNWFSKTKVINWHKVPKLRLTLVGLIWMVSVGLYLYDYGLGLRWLLLLSLLHVVLEFPLNHGSFVGIGEELRKRVHRNDGSASS